MKSFELLVPGDTFENAACKWTVLALPVESHRHPIRGVVLKVRANCEFKFGSYETREVEVEGEPNDEVGNF